jgi:DNA-binding NtrC family response regulator
MKPSILIVDDEKVICEGLARYLSDDYKTYQAYDGMQAIDMVKNNRDLDVILCDLKMPGMDGIDLISRIRSANKNVPMIIITAAAPQNVCAAMKNGANGFLVKPIDLEQLIISLKNAINSKKETTGNAVYS